MPPKRKSPRRAQGKKRRGGSKPANQQGGNKKKKASQNVHVPESPAGVAVAEVPTPVNVPNPLTGSITQSTTAKARKPTPVTVVGGRRSNRTHVAVKKHDGATVHMAPAVPVAAPASKRGSLLHEFQGEGVQSMRLFASLCICCLL